MPRALTGVPGHSSFQGRSSRAHAGDWVASKKTSLRLFPLHPTNTSSRNILPADSRPRTSRLPCRCSSSTGGHQRLWLLSWRRAGRLRRAVPGVPRRPSTERPAHRARAEVDRSWQEAAACPLRRCWPFAWGKPRPLRRTVPSDSFRAARLPRRDLHEGCAPPTETLFASYLPVLDKESVRRRRRFILSGRCGRGPRGGSPRFFSRTKSGFRRGTPPDRVLERR